MILKQRLNKDQCGNKLVIDRKIPKGAEIIN